MEPSATPDNTDKVDCLVVNPDGTCDVAGVVCAITQVGDRTFIGGQVHLGRGRCRANLAAIGPDGRLDQTWSAPTDGVVYALAASSDGSTVFVGGGFTTIGGGHPGPPCGGCCGHRRRPFRVDHHAQQQPRPGACRGRR